MALLVILFLFWALPVDAATRLGLHVTQEELNIWRQRATNGPYRVAGDVSTNSPGDWTRMVSQASQFSPNPLQELWQGQTAAGAWAPDGHSCTYTQGDGNVVGCNPRTGQGQLAEAAAFVTLVQPQNFNYCPQVRQLLLAQIVEPGTDFTNTSKWPNQQLGDAWSGGISTMFTRLAYAYDYCRIAFPNTFSASEKNNIETWFSNAAFYWARNVDFLVRTAFPNRNSEFDSTVNVGNIYATDTRGSSPGTPGGSANINYYDCTLGQRGPLGGGGADYHNNRSTVQVRFGVVGAMLRATPSANDLQSQRWGKMWFKEWLTYSTFPDNTINDYYRAITETPQNGWQYAGNAIGTIATVADLFARAGDTSLYDFQTSAGTTWANNPSGYNANTAGGPKSLLKTMQRHAGFVNQRLTGVPGWVGTESSGCSNLPRNLIQPVDDAAFGVGSSTARIDDTRYSHANVYYKDNNVKLAYTRQLTQAPAYPQFPVTNDNANPWAGPWWEFSSALFMTGQMEGQVNPYVASGASVTWVCDRCTPASGTATGTANWTQAGIQLAIGVNVLTVTATDANNNTATDTITVTYAPSFPGNTMAGAWGFEETPSGVTVLDSSGNSNNGVLINGATWTAQGRSRQGITLNGTNQYVNVTNTGSLQYTQSFAFSAWVKPSGVSTTWRSAISKNGIGGLYASAAAAVGKCLAGVPAVWFITNGSTGPDFYTCGTTPLPIGQWSHIAGTYSNTAGEVRLYVNGVLVTTTAASGYIDYVASNMNLQIGASEFGEYFAGEIDEVRTYNWQEPLTAGSNTTPGAACVFGDPLNASQQSVIRDMNCPVIAPAPPLTVNIPASATGLKVGASGVKIGATP